MAPALMAVSDLHVAHERNKRLVEGMRPADPGDWLIVAGNSTSASRAPFTLYSWDGNPRGVVHHFEHVRFHKRMKIEGVTHGSVNGRGAVVFVVRSGSWNVRPLIASSS